MTAGLPPGRPELLAWRPREVKNLLKNFLDSQAGSVLTKFLSYIQA